MDEIGRLFLSWRKGMSSRRYIIGLIKRNVTEGVTFSYLTEEVEKALKDGFQPYTDFPNVNVTYKENVLEIFAQRLIKFDRGDIKAFIDFWDLDPLFIQDPYYLLAHTQGWLPTDTFEFLADFYPVRGLKFVTDLAGLSHNTLKPGDIKVGDNLQYILEPDNKWDKYAVYLTLNGKKIGYIKKVHNLLFSRQRSKWLKTKAKAIEQNGEIKRIFIEVFV